LLWFWNRLVIIAGRQEISIEIPLIAEQVCKLVAMLEYTEICHPASLA
jgi:hypothetical protein